MSFEDNKSLFLEECRELLGNLETSLLELEQHPDRMHLVHDVFRALHTIKGSGAMFGYTQISDFTHHVENLFDKLRKGEIPLGPAIIQVGLQTVDCIETLLDHPAVIPQEVVAVSQTVEAMLLGDKSVQAGKAIKVDPAGQGPASYRITFRPDRRILHRGVKLEPLLQELAELGVCSVSMEQDNIPPLELLVPDEVYCHWIISLATERSVGEIREVFIFVEDYADIRIEPILVSDGKGGERVPMIGEILVQRGALEPEEVLEVRREQKTFGEVAVESGKVSLNELKKALTEQQLASAAVVEKDLRQDSGTIRVRKEKLDQLVDAVGELVILQARLRQETQKTDSPIFQGISENLGRLATILRDATMNIRMVPLAESMAGFQRLIRDLAKQLDKELHLEIKGGDTELDKNVIEALKDPMVHILRNSADHGIEPPSERVAKGKSRTGKITINAQQAGSRVLIKIADDGKGLDLDRIKARAVERHLLDPSVTDPDAISAMIFEPGFSTAEKATSLSGRGVGMDVVKTNIERLRGEVSLSTAAGEGTSFVLSIPLTLVIVDGLLVSVNEVAYILPLALVSECLEDNTGTNGENTANVIHLRGRTIPVLDLRVAIGARAQRTEDTRLVLVNLDGSIVALRVDSIIGKQQVVIKPFSMDLKRIPIVSGATILGDGSVALIINTNELLKLSRTL